MRRVGSHFMLLLHFIRSRVDRRRLKKSQQANHPPQIPRNKYRTRRLLVPWHQKAVPSKRPPCAPSKACSISPLTVAQHTNKPWGPHRQPCFSGVSPSTSTRQLDADHDDAPPGNIENNRHLRSRATTRYIQAYGITVTTTQHSTPATKHLSKVYKSTGHRATRIQISSRFIHRTRWSRICYLLYTDRFTDSYTPHGLVVVRPRHYTNRENARCRLEYIF